MSTRVTENWSGRRMSLRQPWTAQRQFVVTGPATESDALVAVDAITGLAVPKEGDEHNTNSSMVCDGPVVTESKGPTHYVITCGYSFSTGSNGGETDPLLWPPEISWEPTNLNEAVDRDLDGIPIVYTNGEPIPGAARDVNMMRLTIVKNLPMFPLDTAQTYMNATNDNTVTFAGLVSVPAHHLRVAFIKPVSSYRPNSLYVPTAFGFDVMLDDSLGTYPFQHRFLDASTVGWYDDGGTKRQARFSDGKGNLIDTDIRLDGFGRPLTSLYASIKVGEKNASPTSPPSATSYWGIEYNNGPGANTTIGSASTVGVFIYFKKSKVLNLSPLTALI